MLDEPTSTSSDNDDSTNSQPVHSTPDAAAAAEPVAPKPRRRRATKAAAPAADAGADGTSEADQTGAAAETEPASETPAAEPEPVAPTKRARKAPAKKAAPRKRVSKAAAAAAEAEAPAPLSEEELEAQAAALLTGDPGVEDAAVAVASGTSDDGAATPAKRTRARRTAAVTFQAPEVVPTADVETSDQEDAPAPRRRRRAGTAGAGAPGALMPELIEPVAVAADDDDQPRRRPTRSRAKAADTGTGQDEAAETTAPRRSRGAGSGDDAEDQQDGQSQDQDDDDDPDRPRRRRRGRRGRGGRRPEGSDGTDGEESEDSDDDSDDAKDRGGRKKVTDTGDTDGDSRDDGDKDDDDGEASGTRRRRRRSRGGSGRGTGSDDADDSSGSGGGTSGSGGGGGGGTPRRSKSGATSADDDGVRGITGSTRMAAKRVRRQEGRDSGRKRQSVLSEAEFLARREAVERTMVVRQKGDRTQIAVLEDGILVEHYVTRASAQSYAGNVYLGRVQNVLPSMEAAFVDIGKSRNAVLYAGEVNYSDVPGGRSRSIESVLKSGQEVLVQVSKDPIGHKGARLTGQVSLPGRYLVYVPEGSMTGISRKLPENERDRLKKILKKVVPDSAGVIIRTAAEGASEAEIEGDVQRLQAQWEVIKTKAEKGGAPTLLQAEPDLVVRVVRDVFNEDFAKLIVSGDSEWDTIREYVEFVAPELMPRLSRHTSEKDVFAEHRIDEQLLKGLDRKVHLPSGGSLVIDRTEAMVVVDVNTGKYVGKGGNLEETVTRNNLEAAEEIARQLRLRDLGGIIVVDFIDMVLESNRDLVVRRLVECLGRDRTKHQVAEVTSLGLVQMTRKRVGQGLLESFSETCDCCDGRGVHVRSEPVDERGGSDRVGGSGDNDGGGGGGRRGRGGRGGGGSGQGGSSDEGGQEKTSKARTAKPLPADAPKPGAAIGRAAIASDEAVPDSAVDESAEPGTDEPAAPRRRRRGGRGAGAATVPASDELAELLADDSTVEVVPDSVLDDSQQADTVAGAVAGLDDIQPGQGEPDLPQPDVADVAVEVEPIPEVEAAEPEAAAEPEPEPGPKRRRRATSRPAGPPA